MGRYPRSLPSVLLESGNFDGLNGYKRRRRGVIATHSVRLMANLLSPEQRSRLMALIKCRDTGPELRLRRALWATGLRYRLRPKLPGKPDLAFLRAKVAVFVDGCFWHGCPLHGHQPKSNSGYWAPKLARTQERDRVANAALEEMGWFPLRVWEHETNAGLAACVARIVEAVCQRMKR